MKDEIFLKEMRSMYLLIKKIFLRPNCISGVPADALI